MPKGNKCFTRVFRGVVKSCPICGLNYSFKNDEFSTKLIRIHIKKTHNIDVPIDGNFNVITTENNFTLTPSTRIKNKPN